MRKNNIDLGKYTIASKWEDITLLQWQNYMRKLKETDNKIDAVTLVETFSDIPKNVIYQMPTDLFEKIANKLLFLYSEKLNDNPTNVIEYKGETYKVKSEEKLTVKEYMDINTIIENDEFNYSAMFSVICRKENEEYNDDYVADVMEERIKTFEQMPITITYPIIAFFLQQFLISQLSSPNSSIVNQIRKEMQELVQSIETSQKLMGFSTRFSPQRIMALRRLKKLVKAI